MNPTAQEKARLQTVLKKVPTPHEERCFSILKSYLNRDPTDKELRNMETDANLQLWALRDAQK